MTDKRIALVVPTIREKCFQDFYSRWGTLSELLDFIVIEDNQKKTFDTSGMHVQHLCWDDIQKDLGVKQWIIPRKSDTVRSYAYWKAWKLGYDYILTLDDDCYPPVLEDDGVSYKTVADFVHEHLRQLTNKTKWFNTLNDVKPRGVPFYELGRRDDVVLNHGLWTNVLDYDAPTQLVNPVDESFSFDNKIVPHGSYFPMCGMNVAWKAEYTVLMYHLLMGQWFKRGIMGEQLDVEKFSNQLEMLPFDRFGDIWCGIFMKKCVDILGKNVSTGMPYVRHERASNPFANLKKEAQGLEVNEKLWQYVDKFVGSGTMNAVDLYHELGQYISAYDDFAQHAEYFRRLGGAMKTWASLFEGRDE